MRKLGKKRLLGLLTAAAIVATTVGSFAVWDQLSAEKTASVTINKPVETTVSTFTIQSTGTEANDVMTYVGEAKVNVANAPAGKELKLTAVPKDAVEGVTVQIGEDEATATENTYIDKTVPTADKAYKVKVNAARDKAVQWSGDQDVQVTVTAELVDATP